jgi:hypothetical protein
MRSDIKKLAGIILLPIYIVMLLVVMIFYFLVVVTHLEKTFAGRSIRRLCYFAEKFYYDFYGAIDERDN